jgi:calcineurin-like phosphoesterase family protein
MPAVFLVSDTHFGHTGVCRFTHPDDDTVKLRPWMIQQRWMKK